METYEVVTSMGLEGSHIHIDLLDVRADIHMRKSEYVEAQHLHEEIIRKTSPTSSPWYHANSLCNMVKLDILTEGNVTEIVANLNAAQAIYGALGQPITGVCSWLAAELNLYRGDITNARAAYIGCLSWTWTPRHIRQLCLAALGDPKYRMQGASDTFHCAIAYLACSQKMNDPLGTSYALRCLADLYAKSGDEEIALNLYHAGLQGGTRMDVHCLRAECMVGIADIQISRGSLIEAKEMWEGAHPLFVRSSRLKDAAAIEKQLEQLSLTEPYPTYTRALIQTAGVGQSSPTSLLVALAAPDPETDAVESSLERLAILKAPSDSLAPNIENAMGPRTSTDGQAKLPVLD
jgi:hypothetical protein